MFQQQSLSHDEIHVWFAFPDEIQSTTLISSYYQLLTEEEKAQHQRFHFEKHKHQYLVTRALVKTVLSHYEQLHPADWKFVKNSYGKPEVDRLPGMQNLRFNLSHTDGLVACAVTLDNDLGIDVEDISRRGQSVELADRFFSPAESGALLQLDPSRQKEEFYKYWTLKESYIKACGMGLSIPLDHFSFKFGEENEIDINFENGRNDNPEDWKFWSFNPSESHKAAIAIRNRAEHPEYRVSIRKMVPMQGFTEAHSMRDFYNEMCFQGVVPTVPTQRFIPTAATYC